MKGRCFWQVAPGLAFALLPLLMVFAGQASMSAHADEAAPADSETTDYGDYPTETLKGSNGCDLSLPEARGRVATVIMCMSVECPISNEFLPAIKEVADKYRSRGVNLIGINPNAGESLEAMAAYSKEHKLSFPFVRDEGGKISRRLLFNVTPEARVFDAEGKVVYRGRIDDRYRAGGGQPGAKITHDLARALDEALAGKPITQARTRTVGCPIQLTLPGGSGP
jgi:peroxiredoxin